LIDTNTNNIEFVRNGISGSDLSELIRPYLFDFESGFVNNSGEILANHQTELHRKLNRFMGVKK